MRDYLARLRQRDELTIIDAPVDPKFELAAVTQRLQQQSDRVILFRNVIGARMPVVTNIYGSRRRLCEMIGATDGNFCRRWAELYPGKREGRPPRFQASTPASRVRSAICRRSPTSRRTAGRTSPRRCIWREIRRTAWPIFRSIARNHQRCRAARPARDDARSDPVPEAGGKGGQATAGGLVDRHPRRDLPGRLRKPADRRG